MRDSLRGPGPVHGFWSTTAHPAVIDVACSLGPDFVCIDAQHGTDLSTLTTDTFTTMTHYDVPGLVRVAKNESADIGRALDLGATGIMVPMIDTADEAQKAVAACRYAPGGTRSFGIQTARVDLFAKEYKPICAVQIETVAAVDNIGEIAAVRRCGLALYRARRPDVVVWRHACVKCDVDLRRVAPTGDRIAQRIRSGCRGSDNSRETRRSSHQLRPSNPDCRRTWGSGSPASPPTLSR